MSEWLQTNSRNRFYKLSYGEYGADDAVNYREGIDNLFNKVWRDNIVNIKSDYGTSNANIQSGLDSGANVAYLCSGSYDIDTKLIVPTGVLFIGDFSSYAGQGTILNSNVAGDACIQIGDGSTVVAEGGIANLKILAGTGIDGIGLYLYYVYNCLLENLNITGFTTGTGLKIAGGASGDKATIQNHVDRIYLANNLTNLHLTGEDGNTNSSSDEGYYADLRINLSALANSKGIHVEKGFGNTFLRTSIIDASKTSGTVGIHFDDGARSTVYSARDNSFLNSTYIENVTTAIKTDANCSGNILGDLRVYNPTTVHDDSSGGGTIIRYIAGGLNLDPPSMYHHVQTHINLLKNAELERWEAATNVAPDGLTLSGTGATIARDNSNQRKGDYCAAVTRVGNDVDFYWTISPYTHLKGRYVTAAVWIKTSTASSVRLRLQDSEGGINSAYHTGGGSYELLSVRRKIDSSATSLIVTVQIRTTNHTAYVDGAIAVEGFEVPMPSDSPLWDSKRLYRTTTWDPANLAADGDATSSVQTVNGAAVGDPAIASLSTIADKDVLITAHVQSANNVRVVLMNKTGGALDIASGTLNIFVSKV